MRNLYDNFLSMPKLEREKENAEPVETVSVQPRKYFLGCEQEEEDESSFGYSLR